MKKNWFTIVGIILVAAGAVLSYFGRFALADVTGFAVSMFGAGVAAAGFWDKRTKTDVFSILTIVLLGFGGFLLGFGGFVESTMTTVITGIVGIVAVIAGVVTGIVSGKKKEGAS
jgi:peptidoglycan/LPS O-acetylase OafA/YrhL